MGTGVSESVEVTVDIDYSDFPAVDRDGFALPGRQVDGSGDQVSALFPLS